MANHVHRSEREGRTILRRLARVLGPLLPAEASPLLPFALMGVPLLAQALGRARPAVSGGRSATDWKDLEGALAHRLPAFGAALEAADPVWIAALAPVLDEALGQLPPGGPHLAWLHQYLGEGRARGAIGRSLKRGEKLGQEQLLAATQFFTPSYMVDALLTRGAALIRAQAGSVATVLDPACGGGNFLVHHLGSQAAGRVRGYELDAVLAWVASLEVLLAGTAAGGALPGVVSQIRAGEPGDERGFLAPEVATAVVAAAREAGPLLLATNPPFLGRRLLSTSLREWLKVSLPMAGQDLCVAFMVRCLGALRPGDAAAFVHQSAWMHLSTLRSFRRWLLEHFELVWCADLGSDAFADLSGEKTAVALSVFCRRRSQPGPSTFLRLVDLTGAALEAALDQPPPERVFTLSPARMAELADGGLAYHQPPALVRRMARHRCVGDFAHPMQGTSTGDNRRFVRFAWMVDPSDPDWVRVSKGGGFARWVGLNRYRVRWGMDAAHIRASPGSALRNLDAIGRTQLVYSDTGTRGLNVRLLEPGQVFIASGPGIEVRRGNPLAVMAWLNSRLATCLLRALSPKITVAAGYIRRLPMPEAAAFDGVLSRLAAEAVAAKRAMLAHGLGEDEHRLNDPAPDGVARACAQTFSRLVEGEWRLLELGAAVEARVATLFGLDATMSAYVEGEVGRPPGAQGNAAPVPGDAVLDGMLAGSLDAAGAFRSRRARSQMGREGIVETVLLESGCAPDALLARLRRGLAGLPRTWALLASDRRHRLVLHALGYRGSQAWTPAELGLETLERHLAAFEADLSATEARDWLTGSLARVHADAFHKTPFLVVKQDRVALVRS